MAGQPAFDPPTRTAADSGSARGAGNPPPSAADAAALDAGGRRLVSDAAQDVTAAAASGSQAQDAGAAHEDDDGGPPPRLGAPTQAPLAPERLPAVEGQCPKLNGDGRYTFSSGGRSLSVQIYMRPDAKSLPAPGGPLVLYFIRSAPTRAK